MRIGSYGQVQIWDLVYGRMMRTLTAAKGNVESVAISPDERLVAFAGEDSVIRVWSVEPFAPVAALTWDVPAGPKTIPYNVKQLPPPVYIPPPDRGPITAVVVTGAALALALALGALARRALRRR